MPRWPKFIFSTIASLGLPLSLKEIASVLDAHPSVFIAAHFARISRISLRSAVIFTTIFSASSFRGCARKIFVPIEGIQWIFTQVEFIVVRLLVMTANRCFPPLQRSYLRYDVHGDRHDYVTNGLWRRKIRAQVTLPPTPWRWPNENWCFDVVPVRYSLRTEVQGLVGVDAEQREKGGKAFRQQIICLSWNLGLLGKVPELLNSASKSRKDLFARLSKQFKG